MQAIEARVRTVYYAPTRGRHYLSKQAAIHAEAVALIQQRHPTENPERDERGRLISEGWHWTDIPRGDVLLRRVKRLVRRRMEVNGNASLDYMGDMAAICTDCAQTHQVIVAPKPATELPRYGVMWNGPEQPICTPMPDGYWTPWHLAQAALAEKESGDAD